MKKYGRVLLILIAVFLLSALVACGGTSQPAEEPAEAPAEEAQAPAEEPAAEEMEEPAEEPEETGAGLGMDAAMVAEQFFSEQALEDSIRWMAAEPEGPEGEPWLQYIEPNFVDTSEFAKEGPYTLCFSNAGVNNPWRVVGFTNMEVEVEQHPEIEEFIHVDAEGSDEKQISDIQDLVASGNCDILIVSPNTSAALTPAVEEACEVLPVITFDRGVLTDCTVSHISPIGGYAFGVLGAQFLADNLEAGDKVVAIRILPGVDVLETRWAGAKKIFEEANLDVVSVEFGDGNNDKVKTIITDAIQKHGQIDGVWMDAGATAVAALEAFEDAGQPYPVINGEDQQDFLVKWKEEGITGIAPTFPTFQWRTPILASLMILNGEQIPDPWILPQPDVNQDNLEQYVGANVNMPPLHYAMCGCENMPGYPERWGGSSQ
jgi:ribose transport system substrate-binding protein